MGRTDDLMRYGAGLSLKCKEGDLHCYLQWGSSVRSFDRTTLILDDNGVRWASSFSTIAKSLS